MSHQSQLPQDCSSHLLTSALETARTRLTIGIFSFLGVFFLLSVRLIDLAFSTPTVTNQARGISSLTYQPQRADIVDRNGLVLATNIETFSLYADPVKVLDATAATKKLLEFLPELNKNRLISELKSSKRFVWIKRRLTPRQASDLNALGLPGFFFVAEEERVYPLGPLFSHVVGFVDTDGKGLAGAERYFEEMFHDLQSSDSEVRLTLDARVQFALRDEMHRALKNHSALGAAGLVMDVNNGQVLGLVSLPDFDPNHPNKASANEKFNRVTQGVYELGSLFKVLTFAIGFESKQISMTSGYDATQPLRVGKFLIRDDHPKARYLTVPEIFSYSSNIGVAKMALDIGTDAQYGYFSKLGLFATPYFEVKEVGQPLFPKKWREINTMTAAYGHGIAVSPLQLASAINTTVNGGFFMPATMIGESTSHPNTSTVIFSEQTSLNIRTLMRLAVTEGTGKQANVPGYFVGGKTGTAEKVGEGAYRRHALLSSFVGVFPIDTPKYLVLIILDEPSGTSATSNFSGGGWVAAPAVGNVISRIAPMLGVQPHLPKRTALTQNLTTIATHP